MTESGIDIPVHQALFGYRKGHHLIASSRALDTRTSQVLATLTDGSGPATAERFEHSYTGIPLTDIGVYALFQTWPAPEMPRPGCVWSHVLLIDFPDLARLSDLSQLKRLFLRPVNPPLERDYETPLWLRESNETYSPLLDRPRAEGLLRLLYGNPETSTVIFDISPAPWVDLIFKAWGQQWPRLRRSFSFSTGSLSDRRHEKINFDLQVAPLSSQHLWGRSSLPTTFIHGEASFDSKTFDRLNSVEFEPWEAIALKDLEEIGQTSLRKFLYKYGAEVRSPRAAYKGLVEFYALKQDPGYEPTLALHFLAKSFPSASDALGLKTAELSALLDNGDARNVDAIWASVYFLLQAQYASAFAKVSIDFTHIVDVIWQRKKADVIGVLTESPDSTWKGKLLTSVTLALGSEDIPSFWKEGSSVLNDVIAVRPDLATKTEAWNMAPIGQRALWDALRASTEDQAIWGLTCGAMLAAQCSFNESETVSLAGDYLQEGLANWLWSPSFQLPSAQWKAALRSNFSNNAERPYLPAVLALVAWTLPGSLSRRISGYREDVQALSSEGLRQVPPRLHAYTWFWMVAVGLQTQGPAGAALLNAAYPKAYDAVARSSYPIDAWELLSPVLPELMFGWDWDRCRRLRNALRDWCAREPHAVSAQLTSIPWEMK